MGIRWRSLIGMEVFNAPTGPACYAVYLDGGLAYVGSSVSLRARMYGHGIRRATPAPGFSTPWGEAREIVVKYRPPVRYGDWAMVELRLIRRLQPPMNIQGAGRRHRVIDPTTMKRMKTIRGVIIGGK